MKRISLLMAVILLISCFNCIVYANETKTQYRYHHYVDNSGNAAVCPYYGADAWGEGPMHIEYTEWLSEPLTVKNHNGSIFFHQNQGRSCTNAGCIDVTQDTNRYIDSSGKYWFYQESQNVEIITPTPEPPKPEPPVATTPSPEPPTVIVPVPEAPKENAPIVDTPKVDIPASDKTVENTEPVKPEIVLPEIIFEEPSKEKGYWSTVADSILDYAVDLVGVALEEFTESDYIDGLKGLINHRDIAEFIISSVREGKINSEELNKLIFEKGYDLREDRPDVSARAILYAAEHDPQFAENLFRLSITNAPREIFDYITLGQGDKIPGVNLVLGVFEASADRFWALGEALADVAITKYDLKQAIGNYYDDVIMLNSAYTKATIELALRDNGNNNSDNLLKIANYDSEMKKSVKRFVENAKESLTFGYFLFNMDQYFAIRNYLKQAEKLEFDYLAIYEEILNA